MNRPTPIHSITDADASGEPVVDFFEGTKYVVSEIAVAMLIAGANARLLEKGHDARLAGAVLAAAEALEVKAKQIAALAETLTKATKAQIIRSGK